MNAFDYYGNEEIQRAIGYEIAHIRNAQDKEDCRQEVFAELYDFMPIDTEEAIRIVRKIGARFRRDVVRKSKREVGELAERNDIDNGNYQMQNMTSPWDSGEYPENPRIRIP